VEKRPKSEGVTRTLTAGNCDLAFDLWREPRRLFDL
jgi:hypothetical protein